MEEHPRFFQQPIVRALMGFGGFIVAYLFMNLLAHLWVLAYVPPAEAEIPSFYTAEFFLMPVGDSLFQLFDSALCLFGVLMWMAFFAQFVLPVRTIEQRLQVIERLLAYLSKRHGPAVFIENGIVRAREAEMSQKGPGIIWLDSASAAVLRTNDTFTQAIGPGVTFTKANEQIAGTADLHSLTHAIGPLDSDQGELDPFKVTTSHSDYQSIQNRRWETSALTRDGIEVVATLSVTFHIASKPGEGNTQFGFNEQAAFKAIRDSITRGADTLQPLWSELPARMAVDVWREYVRKFRQDELFALVNKSGQTGLQLISSIIAKRLKQPEVEQFDDFGRPVLKSNESCQEIFNQHIRQNLYADLPYDKLNEFFAAKNFHGFYEFLLENKKDKQAEEFLQKTPSREYRMLNEMGLEAQGVGLKRVMFAPEIEERIILNWTNLWKKNAEKERDQIDRNRKLAEVAGQEKAIKTFAVDASREFVFDPQPNKFEALFFLIRNTVSGLRRNTALLKRTSTERRELSEISNWLKDRGARG